MRIFTTKEASNGNFKGTIGSAALELPLDKHERFVASPEEKFFGFPSTVLVSHFCDEFDSIVFEEAGLRLTHETQPSHSTV